jgi:hypothetical protein
MDAQGSARRIASIGLTSGYTHFARGSGGRMRVTGVTGRHAATTLGPLAGSGCAPLVSAPARDCARFPSCGTAPGPCHILIQISYAPLPTKKRGPATPHQPCCRRLTPRAIGRTDRGCQRPTSSIPGVVHGRFVAYPLRTQGRFWSLPGRCPLRWDVCRMGGKDGKSMRKSPAKIALWRRGRWKPFAKRFIPVAPAQKARHVHVAGRFVRRRGLVLLDRGV